MPDNPQPTSPEQRFFCQRTSKDLGRLVCEATAASMNQHRRLAASGQDNAADLNARAQNFNNRPTANVNRCPTCPVVLAGGRLEES